MKNTLHSSIPIPVIHAWCVVQISLVGRALVEVIMMHCWHTVYVLMYLMNNVNRPLPLPAAAAAATAAA